MVKKFESRNSQGQTHIRADVIVLGCTLPGIVTAHKLKKKFGDSMDIVVLDLATTIRRGSHTRCSVTFQDVEEEKDDEIEGDDELASPDSDLTIYDNVARHYMANLCGDFNIPLPDAIFAPQRVDSPLNKLFQYTNGTAVTCTKNYHDFQYLSYIEKFELEQYLNLLDQDMQNLFHSNQDSPSERKRLLHFDQTTMEAHLSQSLLCSTSQDIMRATVSLVCGASAADVSVLFYLHQCYRTSSSRNHIDGDNTRFREKLLSFCQKRLSYKLQQSIADITLIANPIRGIRTGSDEQVVLETMLGETDYVCSLLAMALRPDQLRNIQFAKEVLSESEAKAAKAMSAGRAKKFVVLYEENFWKRDGYSGDILSIRGPIIWATERPKSSGTGSTEKYAALIGYLKVTDDEDSRDAVIEQLVKLFGCEAASPVTYRETSISDVYIPRCGDYIALRKLTVEEHKYIVWCAFDIFADGDLAASLEAGHEAYLRLLSILRPQAQSFHDLISTEHPTLLSAGPVERYIARLNVTSAIKVALIGCSLVVGIHLLRWLRK